jgi:single-strand DNA-binding protein
MARIEVVGNVGTDPEIKFFEGKNGSFGVASFSLAYTPREKKGQDWVDGETVWFRTSVVGRQAELITDAVRKGERVKVVGTLKVSSYQAKDGSQKQGLEIKADDITLVLKSANKSSKPKNDEPEWGSSWN